MVAEVVSPTDEAEDVFAKVREYLESEGREVWLIFPDSRWVMVITREQQRLLGPGEVASTQQVLAGFTVPMNELIA